MSVPEKIHQLAGAWRGTNSLWLMPGSPAQESDLQGSWALIGNGQFATLTYTWAYGGGPQDGLIVLAFGADGDDVQASWVDSFHTNQVIMSFSGVPGDDEVVRVLGSYSAPDGPDWGWRIEVEPGAGSWTLRMFNILPDGQEAKAVEATLSRAG